jgi:hypothetical protein
VVDDVLLLLCGELFDGRFEPRKAGSGGTKATVRLDATMEIAATRMAIILHRCGFRARDDASDGTTIMKGQRSDPPTGSLGLGRRSERTLQPKHSVSSDHTAVNNFLFNESRVASREHKGSASVVCLASNR